MRMRGLDEDPNIKAYDQYDDLAMEDIVKFWEANIKGKPVQVMIYGPKEK